MIDPCTTTNAPLPQIKQVIVMRKDLKMRRGKEIAQGAHASMAFLSDIITGNEKLTLSESLWLNGSFTKICLRVDSEEELRAIDAKARELGITSKVIVDNGKTEFNGVKTATCLALGPDTAALINGLTGELKLY